MKKRVVGAIVLVIIGVLLPVLLVRCLQGGGDTPDQATRMYEITPKGQAKPARAGKTPKGEPQTDANTGVLDGSTGIEPPPQEQYGASANPPPAVSPQDRSTSGAPHPPPPVAGNGEAGSTPPSPQPSSGASTNPLRRDSSGRSGWVVQVGSFSQEHSAQRLAGRLDNDFDAFYSAGQVNGTTYYRVSVGPFDSEAAARAAAQRLREQGQSTLVRHAH